MKKLPYLNSGLTNFNEILQDEADWVFTAHMPLKSKFLKIQDGSGRYFENRALFTGNDKIAISLNFIGLMVMHIASLDFNMRAHTLYLLFYLTKLQIL